MPDTANDSHVFCLTGSATDAITQFTPLLPVLSQQGAVEAMDYTGSYFNAKAAIHAATKRLAELLENGEYVTVVGASLGANLVPFVLQGLCRSMRVEAVTRKNIKIFLIDPPLGAKTLKDIPSALAGLAALLIPLLALLVRLPFVGRWVNGRFRDPALNGQEPTMFLTQSSWMVGSGNNRGTFKTLRQFNVTYVACDGTNVVRQPNSMLRWLPGVRHAQQVPLMHCEFGPERVMWLRLLDELFNN